MSDAKKAVLFDLGNTLVRYYTRGEFPSVLHDALAEVREYLDSLGLALVPAEAMWAQVAKERGERGDYQVRPLEGRLTRIFQLEADDLPAETIMLMCRCFLRPIFARATLYDDSLPTLRELRTLGFQLGIISNLPWGSPPEPWREEIERHGLTERVDAVVLCRDVGYRKPARQVFEYACSELSVAPGDCLFVGDDPRWDLAGAQGVGMDAVIIDRHAESGQTDGSVLTGLAELFTLPERWGLG